MDDDCQSVRHKRQFRVTMRYKVKKEDWEELKRSIDARVLATLNGDLD